MRFVLLLVFIGFVGWKKEPDRLAFVKRDCGLSVEIISKQDFLINLANKSGLNWREKRNLLRNNPDLSHVLYLINGFERHGIPERLGVRWVYRESHFDSLALSPACAYGFCQIIPETWGDLSKELNFNEHTTVNNMEAGMHYLKQNYDRFKRWDLALAAYNSGPNRKCIEQGRIPRIKETQEYVEFILR